MTIDTSKISKTTINGLLSCAIAVVLAIMALPPKASIPVCVLAVLRAITGFLQGDAPPPDAKDAK